MSEYITAHRIKKSNMNGSEELHTVYTDFCVAKAKAESMKQEFEDYTVGSVKVRILNEREGAVDKDLVQIDRTTYSELCRQTGLAKLNADERAALFPKSK